MTLVVKEGETWRGVAVHRAVIMPLCTFLRELEMDVMREDPVVILPNVSLELLESLIRLIYKGFAPVSEVVTVEHLLQLMRMLGLRMPAERLLVTMEKVEEEVEIVGFKNLNGLEVIGVKGGREEKKSLPLVGRRRSLEITPCVSSASRENKKERFSDQEPRRRRQILGRSAKSRRSAFRTTADENDDVKPNEDIDVEDNNNSMMPLDVKLECEEVEDIFQSDSKERLREECEVSDCATKKRRYSRRKESVDPLLACELCDFKCRFVKNMQKHYDDNHCSNEFQCGLCGFKASTLGGLRVHSARKHSVGKNAGKLVERGEKRARKGPRASNDEVIANKIYEENLTNNMREEKDYRVDGNNITMTLQCINAKESVKAIVGNEQTVYYEDNFSSTTNVPPLETAEAAAHEDNSDITISSMKKTETSCVDIGEGEMHDSKVMKIVENSHDSIAAEVIEDNKNSNDKNSLDVVKNDDYDEKKIENDPLTILKYVKAAHAKGRVKMNKGIGSKTFKPMEGEKVKKRVQDGKEIDTEDVKSKKTDKIVKEEETLAIKK